MEPIYSFGIQLIQALQSLSPALDLPMQVFTFLGTVEFYLLLIPLVYWLIDVQLGIRIFFLLISADFFGNAFKLLLHQPRPYWLGGVKQMGTETSYGFPSTHASDSLPIWGFLAYWVRKGWLWGLSLLIILLIGLSRPYLGVHFPTDVLGGWLLGLVVLVLFVAGERLLSTWLQKQSPTGLIALSFGASILVILIGELILALISSSPDSATWAQFSTQARSITSFFTLAGALFGAVVGYILMRDHARFQVKSAWWQKVACYVLGMAGVLLIYLGLDMLFGLIAIDESATGYILRYIRYGTVTFWINFGAPWLFLKISLADSMTRRIKPAAALGGRPV